MEVISGGNKIDKKRSVKFLVPFDVLLTVRLSIMLVINRRNAHILVL